MTMSSFHYLVPVMGTVIFGIYMASLSPSIAGGDSGELVAEGCALGTAHPPGYPLFTIFVYLLKSLAADPLGVEVAHAVNVSSALLSAGAAALMGSVVIGVGDPSHALPGAIVAMGTFAFSPLIWQYAVTAEVFPLNTFFVALLVYLVVRYQWDRSELVVCCGAFLSGLALCNQHTAVLYEAPLVLWILTLHREQIRAQPSRLLHYAILFILGIALYGYLPISANIVDSPGGWGDVKSVNGIIHHILRRDYGTFQLYSGRAGQQTEGMVERTLAYVEDLYSLQAFFIGPPLALLGAISWIRTRQMASVDGGVGGGFKLSIQTVKGKSALKGGKPVPSIVRDSTAKRSMDTSDFTQLTPAVIVATQVFYFIVFHSLSNLPLTDKLLYGIHQRFWMQPNVVTFIWIGIGFNTFVSIFLRAAASYNFFHGFMVSIGFRRPGKEFEKSSANADNTPRVRLVYLFGIVAAVLLVTAQCYRFYAVADQHDNMHFHNYARALVEPLPQNAVLLVNYDMQWTAIRYMQKCLGMRPDVTAINLSMMTFSWFRKNHHHYPNIIFPGAYYSSSSTGIANDSAAPFSMFQFLEVNSDSPFRTDGSMGGVFLCGKLNFPDRRVSEAYETVPFGLTQTFIRRDSKDPLLVPSVFHRQSIEAWKVVTQMLPELPDKIKYDEHTWEWTIGRDFSDRVLDVGAYLLEQAIPLAQTDSTPLQDAVYWLEMSIRLEKSFLPVEGGPPVPPTSLLKNVGLGHAHLVQSKTVVEGDAFGEYQLPRSNGIFPPSMQGSPPIDWPIDRRGKEWSADMFVQHWGEFLRRDDAKKDPQYKTILNMYETATRSSASKAASLGASAVVSKKRERGERGQLVVQKEVSNDNLPDLEDV